MCAPFTLILSFSDRLDDDRLATQKALQTVVAGRQAENLLYVPPLLPTPSLLLTIIPLIFSDFGDDDTSTSDGQPSGLAATQVLSQTPAAANLLAGTSSNPLDDLVSIFGGNGGGFGAAPTPAAAGPAVGGVDPLAGLGGLSISGGGVMSPSTPGQPQPSQGQGQQEDLLGLF